MLSLKKYDYVSTFCAAPGRAIIAYCLHVQTYINLQLCLFIFFPQPSYLDKFSPDSHRKFPFRRTSENRTNTNRLSRLYSTLQVSHCHSDGIQHESHQVDKMQLLVHHPVRSCVLWEGVHARTNRINAIRLTAGGGQMAGVWGPYLGEMEAVLEPRGWFGQWARSVDAAVPQAASVWEMSLEFLPVSPAEEKRERENKETGAERWRRARYQFNASHGALPIPHRCATRSHNTSHNASEQCFLFCWQIDWGFFFFSFLGSHIQFIGFVKPGDQEQHQRKLSNSQ